MQITSLKLKNFRRFTNNKFEFRPGMNVVIGDNEAGKSTILGAILTGMYIDPATKSKLLLERIGSWKNPGGVEIELGLRGEAKAGSDNSIDYTLKKDFTDHSSSFKNLKTGKEVVDIDLINDVITKLTSIPTATLYRSTALIRQAEVAKIENINDLQAAAENALSGTGKLNVKEVISQIGKKINALTTGLNRPAKNPGKIKQLQDEIAKLEIDYQGMKTKLTKVIENQSSGKESTAKLDEINKKLLVMEELMANQKVYEEGLKEVKEVDSRLKELERLIQQAESLMSKQKETGTKIANFSTWQSGNVNKDGDMLNEINGRIDAKKTFIAKHTQQTQKPSEKTSVNKSLSNAGGKTPLIVAVILVAFGLLGFILINNYFGILAVLGVFIGVITLMFGQKGVGVQRKENNEIKQQLEDVTTGIAKDEAQLKSILAKYKVSTKNEFFERKVKYITMVEQKNRLDAEMNGVLGNRKLKDIKERQLELLTKKREIEFGKLNSEIKKVQLSPQEYLQKRREIDELKIQKRNLEKSKTESEVRVEEADISIDTVIEIEEKLEYLKEELKNAKYELDVLNLIKEAIERAGSSLTGEFGQIVKKKIETYLPQITEGRYGKVKINDDFSIEVMSNEKGDFVSPEGILSAGTVDQIYFAYRLALLQSIEGDRKVPLLLDDPFVTFDSERLQEVRNLLEKEAQNRQIILFTHDKNFENWGNLVKIG